MLNRLIQFGLAATLTAALGTGAAWAQDEELDDEFGAEGELDAEADLEMEGDDMDAEGDLDADAEADADADAELSAEAAPGAPAVGSINAGAQLMLPSGISEDITEGPGLGNWAELKLFGRYQAMPELSVGAELPLIVMGQGEGSAFQGLWVDGRYQVNEMIHANAFLGFGPAARMLINPWGSVLVPASGADNKVGLGVGGGIVHHSGKIAINADANLKAQLESDVNDMGEATTGIVLHVPVSVMYQVSPQLSAGGVTGIYTGPGLSFDSNELMTLPLLAMASYQVNPQISAGGFLGFSSLLVPEGLSATDTLSLGLFGAYSM